MDKEIAELEAAIERIWEIGHAFGLDPFPTNFEIVPATVMYEVGSYALPGRYSHWTFGKAYHRMKTMYDFGLSRIYEVVINSNPSYGFLLETNSPLQNKLVVAHVMGHVDFFKNNYLFRQWTDAASILGYMDFAKKYIAKCEERHGPTAVEDVLGRQTDDRHKVWYFAGVAETTRRLEDAGFTDIEVNLLPDPARLEPGEQLCSYLATVVLGSHLDRMPESGHEAFVREVAARLPEPVVDYVRLNITARRA